MIEETTTQVTDGGPAGQGAPAGTPYLCVALHCDHPLAPPSRHSLAGVNEAQLGRGERGVARTGSRLAVTIADRAMSVVHARLIELRGRWILEDAGSKNGTLVNGTAVDRAVLLDGDLLELGRTFVRFRQASSLAAPETLDLDAGALPPRLATFSGPLADAFAALLRVAASMVPVTIVGETGTGKEVAARAVHAASGRKGPFVALNCGAIPQQLVEATLFGHRKGAFSGAVEDRPGLVRSADGGTLFLDEVGDLPPAAQTALLRVLQEREVVAVGDSRPVRVDFRVVAATHRRLEDLVSGGAFRKDLLARLSGFTLELPPLRERLDDLGLLIRTLLSGSQARPIQVAAARAMFRHSWPLNIRELEHCLETAVALAGRGPIELKHLPAALRAGADPDPDRIRTELVTLLAEHDGNVAEVARTMGKGRMQIHRWLKRFGLDLSSFRRAR